MKLALLIAFAVDSVIHLYARAANKKTLNIVTKCLLMLLLCGWYLTAAPVIRPIVVAALLASWIGDIFLIPEKTSCFVVGGLSFTAAHVLYGLSYLPFIAFAELPLWGYAIIAVYAVAVPILFKGLKSSLPGALFGAMMLYMFINAGMNCLAFWMLLSVKSLAGVLAFVGAILFFTSDSILFYNRFVEKYKTRTHFMVMVTYILAEFLIVSALMMLG